MTDLPEATIERCIGEAWPLTFYSAKLKDLHVKAFMAAVRESGSPVEHAMVLKAMLVFAAHRDIGGVDSDTMDFLVALDRIEAVLRKAWPL